MAGPQNAIVGDDNFGTELPKSRVQTDELDAEKRMASFAKSPGYQELEAYIRAKIDYYQKCLPGNVPAENVPEDERAKYWAVAVIVIREFEAIIGAYEDAKEAVTSAK